MPQNQFETFVVMWQTHVRSNPFHRHLRQPDRYALLGVSQTVRRATLRLLADSTVRKCCAFRVGELSRVLLGRLHVVRMHCAYDANDRETFALIEYGRGRGCGKIGWHLHFGDGSNRKPLSPGLRRAVGVACQRPLLLHLEVVAGATSADDARAASAICAEFEAHVRRALPQGAQLLCWSPLVALESDVEAAQEADLVRRLAHFAVVAWRAGILSFGDGGADEEAMIARRLGVHVSTWRRVLDWSWSGWRAVTHECFVAHGERLTVSRRCGKRADGGVVVISSDTIRLW